MKFWFWKEKQSLKVKKLEVRKLFFFIYVLHSAKSFIKLAGWYIYILYSFRASHKTRAKVRIIKVELCAFVISGALQNYNGFSCLSDVRYRRRVITLWETFKPRRGLFDDGFIARGSTRTNLPGSLLLRPNLVPNFITFLFFFSYLIFFILAEFKKNLFHCQKFKFLFLFAIQKLNNKFCLWKKSNGASGALSLSSLVGFRRVKK